MWLMHVDNRQLEQFFNNDIPPYAILSHTWGPEEVTFQDLKTKTWQGKLGYAKIEGCCQQAKKDGYFWVWVDTCCIDKSSSAELSEAINSMYRWYEASEVCYVYLVDVSGSEDPFALRSTFRQSRWFERGWTLQELIAPSRLAFFGSDWSCIFSLSSYSLEEKLGLSQFGQSHHMDQHLKLLSTLTGIPDRVLQHKVPLASISVACKLSWAAGRKTTRTEDIAYCLMGLLQVNMPLLYGEGEQAFVRLQEVALSASDDITALLWGYGSSLSTFLDSQAFSRAGAVLATTPAAFQRYPKGNTRNIRHAPRVHTMPTGHGLQVDLPMVCIDRTRSIWLGLVTEDLSRSYPWGSASIHGIAVVLQQDANRFERAVGCPPVRIRPFDYKRLWYQGCSSALRTIYLQDNVAHTLYFTLKNAAYSPHSKSILNRFYKHKWFWNRDSIKEDRYPEIPGEELRNPPLHMTADAYLQARRQQERNVPIETLGVSIYEPDRTASSADENWSSSPPVSGKSSGFIFSVYQLKERGFNLHSVYPPLKRGHYYRYKAGRKPGSNEPLIVPDIVCLQSAGRAFTYIFSNGRGSQIVLKLEIVWQTFGAKSCKIICAQCGENDTALQHHPNFASNPMLYRDQSVYTWNTIINIIDIPCRPFHIRLEPFDPKKTTTRHSLYHCGYAVQVFDGTSQGKDYNVTSPEESALIEGEPMLRLFNY